MLHIYYVSWSPPYYVTNKWPNDLLLSPITYQTQHINPTKFVQQAGILYYCHLNLQPPKLTYSTSGKNHLPNIFFIKHNYSSRRALKQFKHSLLK